MMLGWCINSIGDSEKANEVMCLCPSGCLMPRKTADAPNNNNNYVTVLL